MRVIAVFLFAGLVSLAVSGCGGDADDSTPVACLKGTTGIEKALAEAPGEVLIGGETPISACLTRNQKGGDLAEVGEMLLDAVTHINSKARVEPGGQANLMLGYLMGAVERGAEESEGIHSDLVRRLTVAARYAPGDQPLSGRFLATYKRGFDAGRSSG
jgi:hypothetical protein